MNKGPEKPEELKINRNVSSGPNEAGSSEWEEKEDEIPLSQARLREKDRSEMDAEKFVGCERK